MYNKIKKILTFLTINLFLLKNTYADILWYNWALSSWDVTFWDIWWMLTNAIEFFMWLAWTVSVAFIIVWAYQMMYWSMVWDKTKWRNTIIAAIWGFVLSALWYVIVKLILDNFG